MTVAHEILSLCTETDITNGHERIKDYAAFSIECLVSAIDVEQNLTAESTTYLFDDGSAIVWSASDVEAYGDYHNG